MFNVCPKLNIVIFKKNGCTDINMTGFEWKVLASHVCELPNSVILRISYLWMLPKIDVDGNMLASYDCKNPVCVCYKT